LCCTGKNIADGIESLLGAVFLSNNLHKTLRFISEIDLVPLIQADLLKFFPDIDLTFKLRDELDSYKFTLNDTVQEIFEKYYRVDLVSEWEKTRLRQAINPNTEVKMLGHAFEEKYIKTEQTMMLRGMSETDMKAALYNLLKPVEGILNYEFKDKNLLLEAFTARNFMESYNTGVCYEKLEVLGDSVLDYVANSNLIKFTMFEKYNVNERLQRKFITQEDFQPFDAHQAKSMLTKNNFLAQLMCLYGLH
jgi:dsRNA-specific ribonuclease